MPYAKRDKAGKLLGWTKWPKPGDENPEFLEEDHPEVVEYNKPANPNIAKRIKAYGPVGEQLDFIYPLRLKKENNWPRF